MDHRIRLLSALVVFSFYVSSCATVPVTGRKQLDFIPADTMLSMSYQQYGDFLKSNKVSTNEAGIQMVKKVGLRIQAAVERYMAQNGLSERLKNYKWEFNLVESKDVNAWCLPGGKVVVYTGILPLTQDENGLAVVIAHEIGHAIAQHGNERMSQGMLSNIGGTLLSTILGNDPARNKELWMSAYNAGSQYGVILPNNRMQEGEADHLGLIFMSMAGYDPNSAIGFWERMSKAKSDKPMEFFSTHPSDETRIKNIRSQIPEAMKYFQRQ